MVLGASGFIGRWVARALSAQKANLHLIVRNKAVAQRVFSEYDICGDIFELDLRTREAVEKLFLRIRPSITFNLAGYGVDREERDDVIAYQLNAHLVETICDVVAETRDSRWAGQDIIHVGSALEYGTIGGNLQEYETPRPTTSYGKSKLAGSSVLAQCCKDCGMKGLTARLFTVYGPGEHEGRLLPSLMSAARTGRSLPLTAGEQRRDFTYVEDVAEGLLRLGLSTAGPGEIVNLATGSLTSVRAFAESAAGVLQIPLDRLQFGAIPVRAGEMSHSEVSVKRLRLLTSWVPPTQIEQGIQKTLNIVNVQANGRSAKGGR